MNILYKFLVFGLCSCLGIENLYAARNALYNKELSSLFGAAYWKLCKTHNIGDDNPCIGISKGLCKEKSWLTPKYDDEYGISLMVAVDVTSGGAKFCPMSVVASNENCKKAYTAYYMAGDESQCVWLCKKGYTGDKCELQESQANSCDSTKLLQSDYDGITKTDSTTNSNIEDDIPNWGANEYDNCGLYKIAVKMGKQEHDLIAIISDWLPSGHGAFVRPYMIRARENSHCGNTSWIEIYPAKYNDMTDTPAVLTCKNGYKPNANNTDCVTIKDGLCRLEYCPGWSQSSFDTTKYYEVAVNGCYQYRCKETGHGFDTNKNCIDCGSGMQDGVNPQDGTCVHCEIGKIFSATSENTGYCATATAFSNDRLLYGPNGSQNSVVEEQCWTKSDLTEYKDCVRATSIE